MKLFKLIHTKTHNSYYCFAPDPTTAKKITTKELFGGKKKSFKIEDITDQKINEDGVSTLLSHNFVGIPKIKVFMLNSSSAMQEHYQNKRRSGTLWYADSIPESNLWK